MAFGRYDPFTKNTETPRIFVFLYCCISAHFLAFSAHQKLETSNFFDSNFRGKFSPAKKIILLCAGKWTKKTFRRFGRGVLDPTPSPHGEHKARHSFHRRWNSHPMKNSSGGSPSLPPTPLGRGRPDHTPLWSPFPAALCLNVCADYRGGGGLFQWVLGKIFAYKANQNQWGV